MEIINCVGVADGTGHFLLEPEEKINDHEEQLRHFYENIFRGIDNDESLLELRKAILEHGLPRDENSDHLMCDGSQKMCTLRGTIWKLLLGVDKLNAAHYLSLVEVNGIF